MGANPQMSMKQVLLISISILLTGNVFALNPTILHNGTTKIYSPSAPVLTITKTSNKPAYTLSEKATFIITISNFESFDIAIDSITDEIPAGFTFKSILAGSEITIFNSTAYPTLGATGKICFVAALNSSLTSLYVIPANESMVLIYTAIAPTSAASNLTTVARGYLSGAEFDNDVNIVSVYNPLPLSWLSVSAKLQDKNILLNWSVANEENTKYFTVQHSADGMNWKDIGTIPASGNSAATTQYHFDHSSPVAGNNYYRLVQTDVDGTYSYSSEVVVTISNNQTALTVYNNPVTDDILQLLVNKQGEMFLFNHLSQLMLHKHLGAGFQTVSLNHFPKGVYVVKVGDVVKKFVVQ